ncbi:MAG: hypothetical protein ACU0BF_00700 [Paracoccaceae bacterium]
MAITPTGLAPVTPTPLPVAPAEPVVPAAAPAPAAPLYGSDFSGTSALSALGLAPPRNLGDVEARFALASVALDETQADTRSDAENLRSESTRSDIAEAARMLNGMLEAQQVIGVQEGIIDRNKEIIEVAEAKLEVLEPELEALEKRSEDLGKDISHAKSEITREENLIEGREEAIAAERAKDTPNTTRITQLENLIEIAERQITYHEGVRDAATREKTDIDNNKIPAKQKEIDDQEKIISDAKGAIKAAEDEIGRQTEIYEGIAATLMPFAASIVTGAAAETAQDSAAVEAVLAGDIAGVPEGAIENPVDVESDLVDRDFLRRSLIEEGVRPEAAGRMSEALKALGLAVGSVSQSVGYVADATAQLAQATDPGDRMRLAL